MSTIIEVAAKIVHDAGLAVIGTNVFYGRMMEYPDLSVCFYEYAGSPSEETMTPGIGIIDKPGLQVKIRGNKEGFAAALALAHSIRDVLGAQGEATITPTLPAAGTAVKVMRIQSNGMPMQAGYDHNDRPELILNFSCWIAR